MQLLDDGELMHSLLAGKGKNADSSGVGWDYLRRFQGFGRENQIQAKKAFIDADADENNL